MCGQPLMSLEAANNQSFRAYRHKGNYLGIATPSDEKHIQGAVAWLSRCEENTRMTSKDIHVFAVSAPGNVTRANDRVQVCRARYTHTFKD